jgi:hypothetical protein
LDKLVGESGAVKAIDDRAGLLKLQFDKESRRDADAPLMQTRLLSCVGILLITKAFRQPTLRCYARGTVAIGG